MRNSAIDNCSICFHYQLIRLRCTHNCFKLLYHDSINCYIKLQTRSHLHYQTSTPTAEVPPNFKFNIPNYLNLDDVWNGVQCSVRETCTTAENGQNWLLWYTIDIATMSSLRIALLVVFCKFLSVVLSFDAAWLSFSDFFDHQYVDGCTRRSSSWSCCCSTKC